MQGFGGGLTAAENEAVVSRSWRRFMTEDVKLMSLISLMIEEGSRKKRMRKKTPTWRRRDYLCRVMSGDVESQHSPCRVPTAADELPHMQH